MAWNEPGKPGKKDPWGGGSNDQGPPDLDEVVKKMQDKLGSIFGGGKGGGGGGGATGKAGSVGVGLIVVVAAVIWILSGIYIIDEGKRGVVLQFGRYLETTMPGPHWYPRFIQSVEKVDILQIRDAAIGYRAGTTRSTSTAVGRESLMLTQDENIVDIKLAIQYKVKSASDYLFKVTDPDLTLREATESAIREIIGKSKMDFVLTEGRTEIAATVFDLIQNILDRYETGLQVTSVNMQDAQPPDQVQAAFEDAVKAREDNERLKNEAEAYANDLIPKAHGKAARQIEESNAYKEKVIAEAKGETSRFLQVLTEYKKAPEVTRKRLYLDSMESVMRRTNKVVIDVKEGNSLFYLPLDKLTKSSDKPIELPSQEQEGRPAPERSIVDQRRRDSLRSRGER